MLKDEHRIDALCPSNQICSDHYLHTQMIRQKDEKWKLKDLSCMPTLKLLRNDHVEASTSKNGASSSNSVCLFIFTIAILCRFFFFQNLIKNNRLL